jgi:hypothetical protein
MTEYLVESIAAAAAAADPWKLADDGWVAVYKFSIEFLVHP